MSRDTIICLALGLLTVLLFAPVRDHDFINFDDLAYVREAHVQRGLTVDGVGWAFTTMHFANYHPLTWISHMADVEMFGNNPAGHHLVNVAIHTINVVLLYLVLRAMTGRPWPSLAVAALWAVHPLRVESVAWVAERKDLLSALFFLLSIGAYARYVRRKSLVGYAASLTFFALGLMSKPMVVTLPCVLLLLDFWPLQRAEKWAKLVLEKTPFFALSIASAVMTMVAQRQAGAMTAGESYALSLRLGNALWAYGRYLALTFWPKGLAVFYPYHGAVPGTRLSIVGVAVGALIIVGVTAVTLRLWRRERAATVGWLWFLGMLVPTIGVVQVGWQSMADRYTYLPHIGLFVAVVWLARMLLERLSSVRARAAVGAAVTGVLVVILSFRTHLELRHWRNNFTLFTRAIAVTEKNHLAQSALALAFDEAGNIPAAIHHYKLAIDITPNEPQLYYNIGRLNLNSGNLQLAEAWLQSALALDPNYVDALINLGKTQSGLKRPDDAIKSLRRAIELDPNNAVAQYDLAVELAEHGRVKDALPHFARAIRIEPNLPELHYGYSVALWKAGQPEQAELAYKRHAELARRRGSTPLPNRARNPDNRSGTSGSSGSGQP